MTHYCATITTCTHVYLVITLSFAHLLFCLHKSLVDFTSSLPLLCTIERAKKPIILCHRLDTITMMSILWYYLSCDFKLFST